MWEITDDKGTLYSGNEDEIKIIFDKIKDGDLNEIWYGDLRLVQVFDIYR